MVRTKVKFNSSSRQFDSFEIFNQKCPCLPAEPMANPNVIHLLKPPLLPLTLNRMRITIDFSNGSGIFVYEKSLVTASAYRDLRKLNIKRKNIFFLYNPFFHFMNVSYE